MYFSGRDSTWAPRNKRPEKIKDNLKEVEVCQHSYVNGNMGFVDHPGILNVLQLSIKQLNFIVILGTAGFKSLC